MDLTSIFGRVIVCTVLALLLTVTGANNLGAQEQPARAASLAAARIAFENLPESDRKGMQDALIWTGRYNGVPDGTFGRQTFEAIAAYQQSKRTAPSGSLNEAERADLQSAARRAKTAAGFAMLDDSRTGSRIGIPTKVLSKTTLIPNGGTRWQSADDRVTLDTRTGPPNPTLQMLYDRNIAIQAVGRVVTYKVLRPNFLVIAGETATGKFYTRYDAGDPGIRGFSIGYDKALAPQIDRLVVAIANSFDPFGSAPVAAETQQPPVSPAALPPLSTGRRVIGTGIALAPRRVLTSLPTGPCRDLSVGDIAVSGSLSPVATRWRVLDLPRDLPGAIAVMKGAPAKAGDSVLVLNYEVDDPRSLTVVAGVMADESSVSAPLQGEAGGAPVIGSNNQLLGIVEPVSGSAQKVAGIMTTRRHAIIPINAFQPSFPFADTASNAITGTAAIVSFWKPLLVPITCAP